MNSMRANRGDLRPNGRLSSAWIGPRPETARPVQSDRYGAAVAGSGRAIRLVLVPVEADAHYRRRLKGELLLAAQQRPQRSESSPLPRHRTVLFDRCCGSRIAGLSRRRDHRRRRPQPPQPDTAGLPLPIGVRENPAPPPN